MAQEKDRLLKPPHPLVQESTSRRFKSLALAVALPLASCGGETAGDAPSGQEKQTLGERKQNLDVRIKIGSKTITGTLRDSATAKDFISLLPLTIHLKDYGSTEKISGLPRKLTREGAPSGADPSVGDIAYYAPWGNLAIYCGDSPYADGLIILGKIDGDLDALKATSVGQVTLELPQP
ncbi:MAG: hypothetical protein JWO82_4127 [Akkermansiaceae bacterium]|nr:hypothetical protein [Akkermansiaceae bacterium]